MNRVVLVGRLTKDPELRTAGSGTLFVPFSLAINRTFQSSTGERETDFINCVVFNRQAENLARYMKKGSLVGVEGRLQSNNYTAQDGSKRSSINVVCDTISFLESKASTRNEQDLRQTSFDQGSNYYDYSPYDETPSSKGSKTTRFQTYSPYDEMSSNNQKHQDQNEDEINDFNISDDDLPF